MLVELGVTPKVFTGNSRVVKQRGTYVVLKLVMYGTARESGEQETLKHLGSLTKFNSGGGIMSTSYNCGYLYSAQSTFLFLGESGKYPPDNRCYEIESGGNFSSLKLYYILANSHLLVNFIIHNMQISDT